MVKKNVCLQFSRKLKSFIKTEAGHFIISRDASHILVSVFCLSLCLSSGNIDYRVIVTRDCFCNRYRLPQTPETFHFY